MKSISLRLRDEDLEFLEKSAKEKRKNRSEVAREFLDKGRIFDTLKEYREGKISIERAAKKLDMTVGEFMDLLTELGIRSPVTYEDYKEGIEALKEAF